MAPHRPLAQGPPRGARASLFDTWIANLDNFGFNLKLGLVKPALRTELGAILSDLGLSVNGFSWSVFREGDATRPSPRDLGEAERMARVGEDLYYFESRQVQRLLPYMTWEDLRWATRKTEAVKIPSYGYRVEQGVFDTSS